MFEFVEGGRGHSRMGVCLNLQAFVSNEDFLRLEMGVGYWCHSGRGSTCRDAIERHQLGHALAGCPRAPDVMLGVQCRSGA